MMSPLREKGVSKQGYLTKAPFHGESNGTPGAKVKYASCHLSIPFFKYHMGPCGRGVLPYISLISMTTVNGVVFRQFSLG